MSKKMKLKNNPRGRYPVEIYACTYLLIIIIIIMWLVQSWTLLFVRACSMPVDSALGGRRLLAQC